MAISTSITKIRRYLRDPDGQIWSDADLLAYWRDSEKEVAQKTHILEMVQTYRYLPEYDYAVCHSWQREYVEGTIYEPISPWQVFDGVVITAPWMAAYNSTTNSPNQSGYVATSPWQYEYATPAGVIEVPLHRRFERMITLAWDDREIDGTDEGLLSRTDPNYKTTSGTPVYYYRVDGYRNTIALYPRPSAVTHDEYDLTDVFVDTGGIVVADEDEYQDSDYGVTVDVIESDGAILCVFEAIPKEPTSTADTSDFPPWLVKYVEYATLERALGADTDGYIASLRDYWAQRKTNGLEAIKRVMRLRAGADRVRTMGGGANRKPKHARLPNDYADFI